VWAPEVVHPWSLFLFLPNLSPDRLRRATACLTRLGGAVQYDFILVIWPCKPALGGRPTEPEWQSHVHLLQQYSNKQYGHDQGGAHRHEGRPSKPPTADRVADVHATSRNNDPCTRDDNHAMRRRTAAAARRPRKTARTWPPTPNPPLSAAGHPSRPLGCDRPRDLLLR